MKLYIDGDALPNLLKPILLRAIARLSITTHVVANKKISIGSSKFIHYTVVKEGIDEADNHIANALQSGDLLVTADIPLADRAISKHAHAIDHRGELYSVENIKQYLAVRNLMQEIRESGEVTKGPAPFGKKDVHNFATTLNNFLDKNYSKVTEAQ
jgi:uncharacterized protein YaiI (UPF0178 family)